MRTEHPALPGYELVGVLGQGGFATVYRARQLAVGREVAVKIDSRVLSNERDRQRFLREVTAAGQLSGHPHVVTLYDAGVLPDGRPFMVLELCPNGSLADRLRTGGPLPVVEARNVGVRIADALAAAHAAGVLHRDVKPGNIMINPYGAVALADFGLAAMPRPGHELSATREALTPAYAPPEAFRLADPTPAGDVYSLAASVYALLRGRPPHYPDQGDLSLAELIVRHEHPLPDLPGVPPGLTEVLRHAMAADPAHRLPSAAALRDALEAAELHTAVLHSLPARPAPAGPPVPLSQAPVAGAGGVAVPGSAAPVPGQQHTGPVTVEPTEPGKAPRRRRILGLAPAALFTAVAVLATASLGTAAYLNLREDGGTGATPPATAASGSSTVGPSGASGASGATPKAAPSASATTAFQVPVTTQNCPASGVTGAGGACTRTAECWTGMVVILGVVRINQADCAVEHAWETFAIAPLPVDGTTVNQEELEKHPQVRKVCSPEVLAASRTGAAASIPADKWLIEVLPPTELQFAQGLRVYRCVARTTDEGTSGTHFRPRA
ncbi:serine/threonine-protein kinase [Kitasatospora sp. NPDC004240]